jgi:hypothetical protein
MRLLTYALHQIRELIYRRGTNSAIRKWIKSPHRVRAHKKPMSDRWSDHRSPRVNERDALIQLQFTSLQLLMTFGHSGLSPLV